MRTGQLLVFVPMKWISALLLLLPSCQSFPLIDVIPAQNLTQTRLVVTFGRIQTFWNQHGKVPRHATELADEKDRDCSTMDGWGREFIWVSDGKTRVKVLSLGRDGKLGGTGEDADLEVEFVGKQKQQDEFPEISIGNVQ
jgi:Type II secretion system (T2SS), protein G